jgi:uncharacterized protein
MFFTILILSYSIPGMYLFIRLWQLFIEKKYRAAYIAVFFIIILLYPAGMFLGSRFPFISSLAERLSHFILPLILYTFLSVLVTDILLLLNLVFKIVSWEKLRVRSFRYRYFSGVLIISALISVGGIINFNIIRPSVYEVTVPRSGAAGNIRIAFVSDFHLEADVPERFVRQYIRKMKEINPDMILYGGDIVEGSGEGLPRHEEMLRSLKPPLGVYGVMGNHDRFRDYRNNFFTRSGMVLLRDSIAVAGDLLAIAGRIDGRGPRKSASELMSEVPGNLPVIFVDHRPTEIDQISNTAAVASFSGHTHKGQLFPVNWHLNSIYELSHGYLQKNNTHFFVSSGIRLWGPRVRTTGKSEILVVDMRFASPGEK